MSSDTHSHVKDPSKGLKHVLYCLSCVSFLWGKSEDTITKGIFLLHIAVRVKTATLRISNYFSTKNTLLVAMGIIISHWKIPHGLTWKKPLGY